MDFKNYVKYINRLKILRADKDLSQSDIGKILGIRQQQYSRIETGERELHLDQLINLCIFYNVSADYILGFTDEPKALPKK